MAMPWFRAVGTFLQDLLIHVWCLELGFAQRAHQSAQALFLFRVKENETGCLAAAEFAAEAGTTSTVTIGMFGMVIDFFGSLQFYATWCFMTITYLSLWRMTKEFPASMESFAGQEKLVNVQNFCVEMNTVFREAINFIHVCNTEVLAKAVYYGFIKIGSVTTIFFSAVDLITLVVLPYCIAWRVSTKVY